MCICRSHGSIWGQAITLYQLAQGLSNSFNNWHGSASKVGYMPSRPTALLLHASLQSITCKGSVVTTVTIFLLQMTKNLGRLNDLFEFILLANDSAEIQSQACLPTQSGNFTLDHAASQDYVAI